jgi:hypothetical protein
MTASVYSQGALFNPAFPAIREVTPDRSERC